MDEFKKIEWLLNVEDIIDNQFLSEERLQNEGAMYQIMNGMFLDPFQGIRPRVFKPKPADEPKKIGQGTQMNNKKKRTGKKKKKPKNKPNY